MTRFLAAALCVVMYLTLAAAATARPRSVERTTVTRAKSTVRAHWTVERMRKARPVDAFDERAVPDTPPEPALPAEPDAPPPPDTEAVAPVPTAGLPYTGGEWSGAYPATHGKVFFTDGGVDYVCSGTAVTSLNRSVVWTAGHCVNDGPGAFHTNWLFAPAYRDATRPYGTWTARELLTTAGWGERGDISYDLGAAVVGPNGGVALGDAVGGSGIAFDGARAQTYTAFGYPAAPPFSGERLHTCTSAYGSSDAGTSPPTMAIGCNMTGGSSGGGWEAGGSVHSVTSYGYADQPGVIYGPYQGADARALYNTAAAR